MSFKHRFWLIVGIAMLLVTAEAARPSTTAHQLTDADVRIVNRALKGDKLMVAIPRAVETNSIPVSRPDGLGPQTVLSFVFPARLNVSVTGGALGRT